MFFHKLVCGVIVIICKFCTRPSYGATLPQRTLAVFHELSTKEGYRISYRDGPLGWSNLQRIFSAKAKDRVPELICISGIWLVYPHPHPEYMTSKDDVINVISGQDKCVNPTDLGPIGAMRPITPSVPTSDSSITLFSHSNFGSVAQTFSAAEIENGGLKQLDKNAKDVGSFVVVGNEPWSLISAGGKTLCVRPQPTGRIQGLPICYGPDIIHIADFSVNAVSPDCPPEHDISVVANLRLSDCKEFASEKPEPLKTTAIMGRSLDSSSALECRYNITWNSTKFNADESALIAKLLTIRLTHDFESTEQILWPDAKEDIWKTGPLDTAFDIMVATVPENIVNTRFLMVVREFTVYHLNEVWKEQREKGDKLGSLKSWRTHKILVHLLNKCLSRATNTKDRYVEIIKSSYNHRSTLQDFNEKINPSLLLDSNNDPIIEIAWVVSNYAMALCHNLFEYKLNFWDNFVTTFGNLYFRPLAKRWKTPTIISPKTFGVILSGFGVEIQHRRIAFATSRILDLTPILEPFEKDHTVNLLSSSSS